MSKELIKLINDVASSVACTIADSNISIDRMEIHLRDISMQLEVRAIITYSDTINKLWDYYQK